MRKRELPVEELPNHRCATCSRITYESFRHDNPLGDMINPLTVVLGSFSDVTKNAFRGCWVCRLLLRAICQSVTDVKGLAFLYTITRVGLRLSLDDELSVHCWQNESRVDLTNVGPIVFDLEDGEWHDGWTHDEIIDDRRLEWKSDPNTNEHSLASRLVLNPNQKDDQELVIHWIWTCLYKHERCSLGSSGSPELPTRALELGEIRDSSIRLVEGNGLHEKYVTLSHCWGTTNHTMSLSNDNIESMKACIEIADLPKTFQDAVMMTRGIGIGYLWIDSMCIIQPTDGDTRDWEKEGSRMGETYQNSIFTIAADAATNNTEGCLHGKASSQFDVHPTPLFQRPVRREWDEVSKSMERSPDWFPLMQPEPASWLNHVQNSPLSSRAWVLQERTLSSRILHCTMQGFFWECCELRASEYEPLGCIFDYSFRDSGLLNINSILTHDAEKLVGSHWRRIIERYSQLALSVSTDRLPALAGLAQVIQNRVEDKYIAGHWSSSLFSSLLWYRLEDDSSSGKTKIQHSPSWSWASIPGAVKFRSLENSDYPARNSKDFSITAELISLTAESLGANPRGWIARSSLWILGRLRDDTFMDGLPDFHTFDMTLNEVWRGHLPMHSDIAQIGAVSVATNTDSHDDREKGQLPSLEPTFNDLSISPSPDSDLIAGSSRLKSQSIAANHALLQATIKEQMEAAKNSDTWVKLDEASKKNEEAGITKPMLPSVIYDESVSEAYPKSQTALLEVLVEGDQHEGLVLLRVRLVSQWKRVGLFIWKERNVFDGVEKTKLELI